MKKIEIWKKTHSKNYSISNLGTLRNDRNNFILSNRSTNGFGYIINSIDKKNCYRHRLVAIAFLDNFKNLNCINHKDGNRLNNNVDNLEWCTHRDNILHSINILKHKTGRSYTLEERLHLSNINKGKNIGKDNYGSKPVRCIETGEIFDCLRYAARKFNRNHGGIIGEVCSKKRKKAYGYTWEWIEKE